MTTTRRIVLGLAVLYVTLSGAVQASDAIISGQSFAGVAIAIGALGMACAIFSEIMKDVTK